MNPLIMNPKELGAEIMSAAQEDSSLNGVNGYIIYILAFLTRLLYVMIVNEILESDRDVWYVIYGRWQ